MQSRCFNSWLFERRCPKLRGVERAPDRPHSKFKHVYPIVRIDTPFDQMYPTNTLAVVKVLTSQADAELEVASLKSLKAGKSSTYFYCTSRLIEFCPGAALMLTVLVLIAAATTAAAQTQVFVPGNASGNFGNPSDIPVSLVAALTVSGPGTITVTYVSGLVTWDGQGDTTGPNGTSACTDCDGMQFPLDEAHGIGLRNSKHLGALIGVFVPQSRVQKAGFSALDGTKNVTSLALCPMGFSLSVRAKPSRCI